MRLSCAVLLLVSWPLTVVAESTSDAPTRERSVNGHPATSSSTRQADQNDAKERANTLFQKGNSLRKAGRPAEALTQFQAAYRVFPSFKILLNMALTLDQVGRPVEAAAFFDRFIRRGEGQSPADKLALARRKLAMIRGQLASVWISCPVQGALVQIDDRRFGVTPLARWIYLLPGRHRLRLTAPGFRTLERDLTLVAGQQRDLPLYMPAIQSNDGEPVLRRSGAELSAAGRAARAYQRQRKTLWAGITLGAGLSLATAAGVLYGLGVSQGNAAQDRYRSLANPAPPACSAELDGLYREKDAARTKLMVGHVFAGAALVSLGIAVYQLASRPEMPGRSRSERRVSFGLSGGPRHLGAGMEAQF